jgi:hypothetical protein
VPGVQASDRRHLDDLPSISSKRASGANTPASPTRRYSSALIAWRCG